jgi:hypothetical protein
MGNPLGGKVSLLAEKEQTPEFGIREPEPFALVLHPFLAALKELGNQKLELIELIYRNSILG